MQILRLPAFGTTDVTSRRSFFFASFVRYFYTKRSNSMVGSVAIQKIQKAKSLLLTPGRITILFHFPITITTLRVRIQI